MVGGSGADSERNRTDVNGPPVVAPIARAWSCCRTLRRCRSRAPGGRPARCERDRSLLGTNWGCRVTDRPALLPDVVRLPLGAPTRIEAAARWSYRTCGSLAVPVGGDRRAAPGATMEADVDGGLLDTVSAHCRL